MQTDQELTELGGDDRAGHEFYRRAMTTLAESGIPFLVGGAYAFAEYTGIARDTKDFDIFVRRSDHAAALAALAGAGYRVELNFPHWLGKAYHGDNFVDLIFSSGNGMAPVDDLWFERAPEAEVLGLPVRLCPIEEIVWSKGFIMERERYDGADVAHLLHSRAERIDWEHLLARFGRHWRVLASHLVLFGYIYPAAAHRIPRAVLEPLLERLAADLRRPDAGDPHCRGTVLSRAQYLPDVELTGYRDGRLRSAGNMTAEEIELWTEAIGRDD
jgi:hypothetical protein